MSTGRAACPTCARRCNNPTAWTNRARGTRSSRPTCVPRDRPDGSTEPSRTPTRASNNAQPACEKRGPKRIAELLLPEDVLLDVDVSSKSPLIDEIGRHMQRVHAMVGESVALSLSHREQIGSTGLGEGVAIPHARVKNLDPVQAASIRLTQPIPFTPPAANP